jgi:hypothetical protein
MPLQISRASGNVAVASSQDETLRDQGAVDLVSETSGTSELLLSLMGILPIKKVEVEVSPKSG